MNKIYLLVIMCLSLLNCKIPSVNDNLIQDLKNGAVIEDDAEGITNEDENIPEKAELKIFKQEYLLNWFERNKDRFNSENAIHTKSLENKININYFTYNYSSEFNDICEHVAYGMINKDGYSSLSPDQHFSNPFVIKEFNIEQLDRIKYCNNYIVWNEDSWNQFYDSFKYSDSQIVFYLDEISEIYSNADDLFINITYYSIDKYEAEVSAYEEMEVTEIYGTDAYYKRYGDSWINKCIVGKTIGSYNRMNIIEYGNHTKEEIVLAWRILNNKSNAKIEVEDILWAKWILNSDVISLIKFDEFLECYQPVSISQSIDFDKLHNYSKVIIDYDGYHSHSIIDNIFSEPNTDISLDSFLDYINSGSLVEFEANCVSLFYKSYEDTF